MRRISALGIAVISVAFFLYTVLYDWHSHKDPTPNPFERSGPEVVQNALEEAEAGFEPTNPDFGASFQPRMAPPPSAEAASVQNPEKELSTNATVVKSDNNADSQVSRPKPSRAPLALFGNDTKDWRAELCDFSRNLGIERRMEWPPIRSGIKKSLVAMAVGEKSKTTVDILVRKFGFANFTFFLMHHDQSSWNEFDWYKKVTSVRSQGQLKWWFAHRFLTPHTTAYYEYIFFWDDDLNIDLFEPLPFLEIMREERIQVAQPALTHDSQILHPITRQFIHPTIRGRMVNFVEIMAPVFKSEAWVVFWKKILQPDFNYWGFGYDNALHCMFDRMAIIDKYPIRHPRKSTGTGWSEKPGVFEEMWLYGERRLVNNCGWLERHRNLAGI